MNWLDGILISLLIKILELFINTNKQGLLSCIDLPYRSLAELVCISQSPCIDSKRKEKRKKQMAVEEG